MNPLISIIVPVYNTSALLPACIDSIRTQTWKDWELLLIDDGSTDDSLELCHHYAALDARIETVSKPNGGVGSARNCGLEKARGSYVLFIDSDDYVNHTLLETLYNAITADNCELALCGYTEVDDSGQHLREKTASAGVYSFEQYTKILRRFKIDPLCGGPVAKLYQTSLLRDHHLLFPTTTSYAEDFIFNMNYLKYCQTIAIVEQPLYSYRISTSGSLSKRRKEIEWLVQANEQLSDLYRDVYTIHHCDQTHASDLTEFYFYLILTTYVELFRSRSKTNVCEQRHYTRLITRRLRLTEIKYMIRQRDNRKYALLASILYFCRKSHSYTLLTLFMKLHCSRRDF